MRTRYFLVILVGFLGAFFPKRGASEMVVMGSATDPFQEATDYLHALDEDIFGSFINMGQIQLMIDVFMDRMACQDIVGASTCYEVCFHLSCMIRNLHPPTSPPYPSYPEPPLPKLSSLQVKKERIN